MEKQFEKSLLTASKRHDIVCVDIYDDREKSLPDCGVIELEDSESGERLVIDTSDSNFRRLYEEEEKLRERRFEKIKSKLKLRGFGLKTGGDIVGGLEKFMRAKRK
jgi:hypothetical protein